MTNANISYEILSKNFSNEVSKQAYMECVKWLATHVYNKQEIASNISVRITKDKKAKLPTFNLVIYLDVDRDKMKQDFCGHCKSLHSVFYSIDKINCNECKMNAYFKHNNKYAESLKNMFREIIENGKGKKDNK